MFVALLTALSEALEREWSAPPTTQLARDEKPWLGRPLLDGMQREGQITIGNAASSMMPQPRSRMILTLSTAL